MAATATTATSSPQGPAASDDKIQPKLLNQLEEKESVDFWVHFDASPDLSKASSKKNWDQRGTAVARALQKTAATSQRSVVRDLQQAEVKFQSFWATNAIKVSDGDLELAERLAGHQQVDSLWPSFKVWAPKPVAGKDLREINAVEWGIANIKADQVWDQYGVRGEGVVIASIDTGAQYDHPALVDSYRGNNGDGTFDHNYNWFDAAGNCADAPCDLNGHGTHTMGTMVGDDGAGNQIGVAPEATWITANGCCPNDAALIASGEWMLEPLDLNGQNADASKRPNIINNSWGSELPSTAPFMEDISIAWEASGIFGMWANGNSGELGCNSSGSPGSRIINYSAGAYDSAANIASFSGRGPGQDGELKPNISAPGVNVRSSVPGDGYQSFGGTSMASPHVAGAIALLWSASSSTFGQVQATKDLLDGTAVDHPDDECGGTDADNNVFGEGQLDALALVDAAAVGSTGTLSGSVTDAATGDPIAGAEVTATGSDTRTVTTAADGTYSVILEAGDYEISAGAFGYAGQSAPVTITADQTTTQDFALDAVPSVRIGGSVTDGGGHGWPLYARITIDGVPGVFFTNPENGRYSISVPSGSTYQMAIEPLYNGYQTLTEEVEVGSGNVTHNVAVPVDPSCTAEGYEFSPIETTYEQDFNTGAVPDGWSVVDHLGNGQVWTFDDPGGRTNRTGGDGAFAVVDSDEYGGSGQQDTSLVTPVFDFSDVPSPIIGFKQDYNNNFADFADVDVSLDDGATWQNLLRQQAADIVGPDDEIVAAPQAGGESSVQFRFHYHNAAFEWWWEVDDMFVGNRTCDPTNAGLIVGNARDANTDFGVNDATVTNDTAAASVTTMATPDDPALDDGFYWMVSPETSVNSLTASADSYVSDSADVDVEADWVTPADFVLDAGLLSTDKDSVSANLRMDRTAVRSFTVTNEGTAPAEVSVGVGGGEFEMLGGGSGDASSLRYTDEASEVATRSPSTWSMPQADKDADGPSFGLAPGHEGGQGKSRTPAMPKTPADSVTITHSVSQEIIQFNSVSCNNQGAGNAENGFLRTFSLEDFDITSDFNVTSVSFGVESATATQPITVKLYTLEGDDVVYENMTLIGSTETTLQAQELSMVSVPVEGSAPAGSTLVVELDSPNLQDIGAFFFPGSNNLGQTAPTYLRSETCGLAEPTPTDEVGFPDMHLVMNVTGEVGSGSLPWVSATPETLSLDPGESARVRVDLNSFVDQPGAYTARVNLGNDTPYDVEPVGVTMNVTPPVSWGKLVGTVTGTECDGTSGSLADATVQLDWWSGDLTLYTDENGQFAYWLDARGNPYSTIVAKDGYKPKAGTARILRGETVTANVALQKARC